MGEKHKYTKSESQKCYIDAEYYLDNNNYDFNTALAEYKADIQKELDEARERYNERKKKKGKKGKKSIKKVGSDGQEAAMEEPANPGCLQGGGCSIF